VKIVHLLGWYFPDSVGGTEVYVEALCRRLRAADHEVLVAAPDAHHAAPERYQHDQVPVFRFAIPAAPTRDEAQHRVPVRGSERFSRWLAEERPDILHVHSFTTGVGLPEIREAHRLGIRVIVTCHLPGFGYMCRSGELMQWGRVPCDGIVIADKCASCNLTRLGMPESMARIAGAVSVPLSAALGRLPGRIGTTLGMAGSIHEHEMMQRELFGLVDWLVVLNEIGRRMLVANGSPAEKIVLNRLGVSHMRITPKPGPDVRPTGSCVRFGYIGRLHATKGLMELARAVAAIPRDVEFRLDIRGPMIDEPARRFAAELQAMLAGDTRVTFGAGVPGADVPALLAGYDVLLCPSMWFENGPTIALEAMAAGTPVIASRVGNLAELIVDDVNGQLVAPGDVQAWARAVTTAATSPAETIDRWRRALQQPRTMDEVASDYRALYAETSASRRLANVQATSPHRLPGALSEGPEVSR
jgi:glycosyltransferase involved in cell wall biosynthesis